jgi:hypothetical protein
MLYCIKGGIIDGSSHNAGAGSFVDRGMILIAGQGDQCKVLANVVQKDIRARIAR